MNHPALYRSQYLSLVMSLTVGLSISVLIPLPCQADPSLSASAGSGTAHLENSKLSITYQFDGDDGAGIQQFYLKTHGVDQAGNTIDNASFRGPLGSDNAVIYDGTDRKAVWLHFLPDQDDNGCHSYQESSIFPDSDFIRIDYYAWRTNVVDLGAPGGQGSGIFMAHGSSGWVRGLDTIYPNSYYNRFPPDESLDDPCGGSLNYRDFFITAIYRNGVGFGRVFQIAAINRLNLIGHIGFESFGSYGLPHKPYTSFLYTCTNAPDDLISTGQAIVDDLLDNGVAQPTVSPAAGSYMAPLSVSLQTATSGATIRYTTDGSAPNDLSTAYSSPINLTAPVTDITAKGYNTGQQPSLYRFARYVVNTPLRTTALPEPIPLGFYGATVGDQKDATFHLASTANIDSAEMKLTVYDIDQAAEAEVRVNGNLVSLPSGLIGDGLGIPREATFTFDSSYLVTGQNTVNFRFADDLGGSTGGYQIRDMWVTVYYQGDPDTQPPTVPQGLTAQGTSPTTVSLDWNDSIDDVAVYGYRVFRDGGSIGTTGTSDYTDSSLTGCMTYSYAVTALDTSMNESAQSSGATATTTAQPQNANLDALGAVDEADLAILADHWLEEGLPGCPTGDLLPDGRVDLHDFGLFSSAWTGPDTLAPGVPTGLAATNTSATTIELGWTASTDNTAVGGVSRVPGWRQYRHDRSDRLHRYRPDR